MKHVVIENPILNSPFAEPKRHFRFSDEGITDEIIHARRVSSYFVPIARPKKQDADFLTPQTWTGDRIKENKFINDVRQKVAIWRKGGYAGVTRTSARLLEYWNNPERERKLFFCQIEALETLIYLTEAARRFGDAWIENDIRAANEDANPGLYRVACKMATGSGKTVVMAMLIAWQTLNKLAAPQDSRFTDTFLIVTPGITIRDRLRVLLPNDPQNYYQLRDIAPPAQREDLKRAKIVITNFHAFKLREKQSASKLTKIALNTEITKAFTESPGEMVRRVCRELGTKKNIIVINDEAHHCYRHKPETEEEKLKGDDKDEAKRREEAARIWISGLEAVKEKIGVKTIYDLSATPFFLRGSGYNEGTLFPWVASDFSLIDAIESGIVKVPRVPVADDSMTGDQPTYRDLWQRIRDGLPKKGLRKSRKESGAVSEEPKPPKELQGALHSLYSNYEKSYRLWEQNTAAREKGLTPPVFIVVCNNTHVSKMVYDYVSGWEKSVGQPPSAVVVPGALEIFRNDDGHGHWLARPNTILIDSEQLDSGEAMSPEFKKIAAREIEEFKADYLARFPGRDVSKLTDEDLLREVMNTVGKQGKLGEQVKCVVSVSMLTEGWDANTVTHILGVRAFGTQLLCEQVVGRGLRRMSYAPQMVQAGANGKTEEILAFAPEYAEVYGVPFSFIPCSGSGEITVGPELTRVRALDSRAACEITFPRVIGYRYELPAERLGWKFTQDSKLTLSTQDIPSWTENAPIVGETTVHKLEDLHRRRPQEVVYLLAKLTLEKYFNVGWASAHHSSSDVKAHLFPQILNISRHWLDECVRYKDNCFPQMLLLIEQAHNAADRIYRSIVAAQDGEKRLLPIMAPYDPIGSTRHVDFDTARPVYLTDEEKCHINYVVCDTESWEQKMAQNLEKMPRVLAYVKNHNLGFTIPYTINGEERQYVPDFIARIDDGRGPNDPLNLIIEVTGEKKKDKEAKVATARTLWIPAVNHAGSYGRWEFVEVADPWSVSGIMETAISTTEAAL